MKRFFDSSVLIPVFYADHPHHASSAKLFLEAGKDDFCALRTLGEVYATLTGLPLRPRITGPEGISIVKQIRERLTLITLNEQEYFSALELASSGTIVGAAAYDALIAHCALKARADTLLTWNVRDFTRFGSGVARLVKGSDDFAFLRRRLTLRGTLLCYSSHRQHFRFSQCCNRRRSSHRS